MTSLSFSFTLMTVVHFFSTSRSHLAQVTVPFRVTTFSSSFLSYFLPSAWASVKLNTSARTASIDHAVFIVIPPLVAETIGKRPIPLSDVTSLPVILARSIRRGQQERNELISSRHISFPTWR